jgi:hypothetical protein
MLLLPAGAAGGEIGSSVFPLNHHGRNVGVFCPQGVVHPGGQLIHAAPFLVIRALSIAGHWQPEVVDGSRGQVQGAQRQRDAADEVVRAPQVCGQALMRADRWAAGVSANGICQLKSNGCMADFSHQPQKPPQ